MQTNSVAIWLEMEAKPGRAEELEALLKFATSLVKDELDTTAWFAVRLSESKFGIFDTFADDAGRQAHLTGEVAKALVAKADELLVSPLHIQQIRVIAEKR